MKCALTALVTIFTTFSTSAVPDQYVNHHLRPHRTLQGGEGSSHFRINETGIHLLSPPVDSTCNFTLGLFINCCASGQQQSATPRASDSRPSGSRSPDAGVTIGADLRMLRTPLRLWPLAFLSAVSQSQGVWRPAIGLVLALGLPQTEAGAAPSKFPAELALTSDDETAGEDSTQLPEQQQLFGYNINQRRSGDSSSELVHRARSTHCLNIRP